MEAVRCHGHFRRKTTIEEEKAGSWRGLDSEKATRTMASYEENENKWKQKVSTFVKTDPPPDKSILSLECLKPAVALRMIEKLHSYAKPVSVKSSRPCKVPVCEVAGSRINSTPVKAASLIPPQDGSNTLPWTLCCPKTTIEEKRKRKSAWLRDDTKSSDMARALPKYEKNEAQRNQLHAYDENYIVYIQGEDIQQLISDEEELPPQSHGGCSTLELEDPLPPHIKEEQKHPQLPHVKDEEDPQFPHMKKEEEDPQLPHIKKEEEDPQLPHIKKEAEDPQLPHIKKEEEDPQFPYIIKEEEDPQLSHSTKEKEDPQLPHVKVEEEYPQLPHSKEEEIDPQLPNIKEEQKHPQPAHIQEEEEDPQPPHIKEKEEEFDVSKLPLTGGSVKSIEEKPPEGSELHHLCASEDHCGGPPPDILMSPLSDSDKVPLTRDKDCKGFIMATRSSRRKPPLQDAKEHAVKALDKTEELEVQFMNSLKGRGVFAKACFQKGDFVVEYRGELINSEESKRRRMTYHKASAVFMFDFCWKGDLWCIDASVYDGSLGRLINADYRHPNCQMKRVTAKDKPHLCLFALRDIQPGEEITCDLGEKAGPQTKQDLDESEVLSSDKVGIIPPPHLVVLSDSNESQNPCTSSSQLNGNSQKTKEQMELDSDKLLDPSLDGSSKEYITKRGENPSSGDGNTSNINVSIDQKRKMQRFPNVENSDGCPSLQERDAALKPTLKRGCSPIRNKSPFGKRERFSVSFPKTDTSSGNATKEIEGGDTGSLSEDSAPDMEEYLPDRSPSLDKVSVDLPCVPAVCKKKDGSRIYNKKQYCLYCKTGFVKISRHLERAHRDKPEVARALSFAKRSKGRSMCLERLRNQGNFTHNVEVLNSGIGTPVPRKRPKDKSQVHNFLHCTFCQGFFLKHALWKHMKFCKFKPSNPPNSGKMRIQALCGFTAPAPPGVKEQLWKLINRMIMDDVYEAVKSDPWIMEYGQHLYNRHGHDATKHEYIRQQMRALGRLLVCSRKNTPMKTIKDHMRPSNFMHVVQAAKDTAGYNCETRTYKSPSLALKIGYSLERISKLVESNANVRRNDSTLKYAKAFRTVYKTRWNEIISSASLKTLKESKWNAPQLLPFTEDVQTLHSFLDTQQQDLFRKLSSESSPMTYAELTKVILTQIILFNRPRAGEVSKIPLSAYLSSTQSDPQEDVNFALSDLEKRLFQHFWRIEIRGKADRKVPVLLTPVMHQTLDLLVRKRNECGILPENTYLFARPSSLICYRGSDTLRNFAKVCGAKRPESLSSKKLHKQMGTLSQVLNLTNPELDQLANFLGHDVTLQQQFYRLPEGILQLAKISKVLMAREQGRLAQFKGKSLDDVNIDPAEDVHMYSDQDRDPEEPGDAEPAYESDSLDIQQLISDEEELPPQLHMGCSSLEHEDPLPPHIKEEQKHPQLPHVKKEEEDSQLPYVKVEEEDPQPPHIKEEAIQRKLPNIKEEQTHPQPADIKENEEDRKNPHVKEKEDPQLPHIKEVEEGFDLSKLPLTGGSVKSKEKPPEGSELHHHSPSVDHCGGPPPDNLMAPLSDSDKVPLTRDKDCKGFIMATRSSRRKPPLQDAQEHAVKALDKTEELEVQFMNSLKGRGVFAKAFFQKGDFVVEYRGELINSEESKRRRMTYHKASAVFMFDFCWKEDLWCIDASVYDGSLGRLVNADDRHPNCQMKRVIAKDKPHLCLFALRDIQPGEEITFDLGEKAGPQSKQDLDEPEVLSSDKVGLIPPPHLVELSDSNESQNPCTSSSQLNGNSQKTKEQMELDSDKLLDPSLDGSSKEYITKREDVHMYSDQDRDPEEPGDAEPAYESDTLDIQQLISDEEELHPLHGGCSSLEHEDPLPPRIKEEQKHPQLPHIKEEEDPQLPHVKKEQEDPQLSYVKVEEEDPQPPHVEEEEIDPKLPNIKEEQKHPQPAHIHEEEEDPKLPHVKEEEEELGVSKLPLTGGSVKCKQEKPLEGSELHHHSPSKDHCGGPPPDNLMAPLSDSDKVSLTRDKDCKGFIMATRSSRRKPPLQDAQEHAVKALDKTEELEVQFMNSLKGRGVFAKAFFRKGDFVVEYRGELINSEESKRRRMTYHKASAVFMFDFCWKEDLWCIDASVYDGSLGRLVNADDRHPNCQMKRVIAKDKPHLCLFALRDIQPGEEITFDLGEKAGPQSKQDLDEPEVLSSDKVGLIPPPHLVELSDSNESQNPCTSSSQLNGNSQKTKEQMELDSDKLLDPSLDGSSKEYITKRGEDPSSVDTNSSNINVSIDQKRKMQRFPNVENSDECPSLQERDAALKPTLKRGCSPIRNKSASGKRKRCSVSCPKTDTSSGNATKERELGDTGSLSEDSAPDMEEYLPERSPSLDKVSVDFPCVPAVCKKEVGSRIYNKKQYCLYCKTEFVKLSRHLERAHRDKPEVARALSFAKRSKGRSMCLERLRNQSNFPHNFEVLNSGVGTPVSRKRPKDKPSNLPNFGKIRFQPLCGFTAPPPPGVKEQLWKLINSMIMDDVYESVNSDPWIMEYCQYLYNRDRHDATKHECIRQQMRALGRLLVCSRKNTPMKTIKDHMRPSNFMHVVQAAKDTAGYNCETRTYKSPSLALKIGCSLERISKLVESNANVRRNDSTLKYAKAFRTVYKTRWNELISSASLKTLNSSKCNAPQLLPFTKDVQTLHSFLDTQQQDLFRKLSSESSPMTYAELTKVILTQIILFNRPRAGEVSKIPLSAHLSSTQSDPQEDVNFALSDLEKRLFQHFWRIEISGQADRNVPVLLTPVMHQTLDLLVRKRNECGILPENTYLFARPSSLICYRGSDTLRNFAKVCGAKRPESLSSKKLHKQMGTLSQVLNLTNPELDQLANFLGHDVTLQQQFYRLPEGILQLAKISEVLMAREQGRLAQFKGKSLDDVNIDPAEDVHMYSDQDRDPEEPGDAEPAYESDSLDIQQLISDEEELHPLHGGCSSLEHEDPLPPRIKEEQKHPQLPHIKEEEDPQLPHVKKEQEDPQLSYVKVEEEDPQPPHVEEEEIDPKLPNIKEEQKHPQPAHIHEEEEDPKLPHVKEEEEELGVSKLPLTGGSVKSKQEKPLEGSELHHHSPSKDHCGGPPPDNLMAPLSDSDKVSLTRDKDCKGFIMATRSSRRKPPLQDAQEHAVKALDKTEELEVQFMNSLKGRGVFTKAFFRKGDFVVEYRGELINSEESKWRRMTYHKASAVFMFDFCWKGDLWCIDASVYDGSLGRLVNADYKHPNCQMKRVIAKDKPHLCLFALRDIQPGEEITCDFGGKAGPQTKQDLDEPEVLSSDKVGIIPPPHLVELSDSNESQNPCTSSSQLNGNSQKTKEQMELDSDKLLDPSLDGSSKEYITKHDIQQLISDEEELHLQLHGGCSSLELEDPLPPHIKEEQMHPQLPPVKEEEDPQLPHVKKEEEDPQLLYVKVEEEDPHIEEEIDPKLPNIKEEQKHPQPAHIQEEEEDPQLPHVKEEEEEFDVSKLPLTGVSVKSKEEKPLEGSELHHHSPSEDHCGGPPPDNLMAPLSDSDKVPLTRDIDCKDIQQLISDEEEVPPQLHEGCSSLEHEDPLPPHIKEEQKHPQLPHVKEEDSQLPDVKKEEEDPQLAYVKVEEEPPHIKEEQKHPQPPHIQEEEEDPKLPHVKEEEEEFGVSKLPLTGGSVKSKEEKPPEGSELHHHGPSEDHYGGPPPDNLMAPLSDSDKVPLSRDKDCKDIQQLISDDEVLPLQLHEGCSSLEHEDPLPPHIKEEQKHPQLPHVKEEEDSQLPNVKKEEEDPQLAYVKVEEEPPHIKEEEIDPKLPHIKEEQKYPQPPHIQEEEEDPQLPHVKEEEEEFGVSKLPLTGGSVKSKEEKPPEGSELHHHSQSEDHCGAPPPDNLMASLSDSDKVHLTRDKDCKGFIMATRSSRGKPPLQDAKEHAVKALDKTAELEVQFMNSLKGRGVFTKAFFRKGDFVVEYRGELINSEESKRRRMTYHKASAVFMFDFCWKGDLWCIDASVYDGSLGRLVNADDRHPNCQMKRVIAKDKPHLCLFALRDIQPGEEITFDLGEKAGPQSKQDFDEPEVLSSDKVGIIPPPHLVTLSDSNESQNPCTSSSQLNGNSQKTKEQMELDSDKLLDPSLDGSSKEYITKHVNPAGHNKALCVTSKFQESSQTSKDKSATALQE
ncbi:uncharacterized protein LOC133475719 isoform X12 [Phyllopteryx taeniolatus]|uniref:uncharacterized protein LOC133475719 isoform X12 n=1 Tax=Phyllopteryx taeniolatus TaxID=161469 RepID=UPI002AD555D9|nr:uncharacterized protein LOC133475719 isoform X12 [Phyllopteryx taeniolatus]